MKQSITPLAVLAASAVLALPHLAPAQASTGIPPAITTPDKVSSRIALDFKDGAGQGDPGQGRQPHFTHAFRAFVDTMLVSASMRFTRPSERRVG
jgi:hypothetical protein